MITVGKVQTNENDINVLVETDKSTNQHYSHLNKLVNVTKILTDEEIIAIWETRSSLGKLEEAKRWIKGQDGYAVSNCLDEKNDIKHSSIIEYKLWDAKEHH